MSEGFDQGYPDSSYGSPQGNGDGNKGLAIASMVLAILGLAAFGMALEGM